MKSVKLALLAVFLLFADNLCEQFEPRSVLIWIQNVWHSDNVYERIFERLILKKISRQQMHEKLPIMQRVNSKWWRNDHCIM